MKKIYTLISSDTEKNIIALTASAVLAIFFDTKHKKPKKQKNFLQRLDRNYKLVNDILLMSAARQLRLREMKKHRYPTNGELKSKLKNLKIQDAQNIKL